jgi:hypothetical protein
MAELPDLQQRFLNYLLRADDAIVSDIVGGTNDDRARRLSIYYNAYRIRLRGSIEIDHPVLGIYLGDDGFETLASAYIAKHPSDNTSLRHFCDRLPEFLRTEAPFADIPVLSQIARFERVLMDVYDAVDAESVDMSVLSDIPAECWPELSLQLHPSLRWFVTDWNCVDIWRAIKAEQAPPIAKCGAKQAWLLWRNADRLSEFRSASVDEYVVLSAAEKGETFAQLCEALLEWHSAEKVASHAWHLLSRWVDSNLIVAVRT